MKVLIALACFAFSTALLAAEKSDPGIDEPEVRKLVVAEYHLLFRDKFFFNPVDGKHHKFPELNEKFFHKVELKDGIWRVAGDPPAGVHVYASVSADGKWVQLTKVGFAPE